MRLRYNAHRYKSHAPQTPSPPPTYSWRCGDSSPISIPISFSAGVHGVPEDEEEDDDDELLDDELLDDELLDDDDEPDDDVLLSPHAARASPAERATRIDRWLSCLRSWYFIGFPRMGFCPSSPTRPSCF